MLLSAAILQVFPFYTGETSVTILPTESELAYTKGWTSGSQFNPSENLVATHIEYLESRPVAERTLEKIKEAMPPRKSGGKLTGWKATAEIAFKDFLSFAWETYSILNYGYFVELTPHEQAIQRLLSGIDIEAVENSFIIKISVSVPRSPEAAAIATNSLAEAYIDRVTEQQKTIADSLDKYFDDALGSRMKTIEELDQREFQIRKELGILSLDDERQALLTLRDQEQQRLLDGEIAREELRARLKAFAGKQSELQRQGVLERVEEEIAMSTAQFKALEQRNAIRQKSLEAIDLKLEGLNQKEQPLVGIATEKQLVEDEIADLRARRVVVDLSRSSVLSQLRVVNPAIVPDYPSFPEVVLYTIIGFFGSAFIGLFVLIVIDTVSNTLKTEIDLKRLAGDRGLGRVPRWLGKYLSKRHSKIGRTPRRRLRRLGDSIEPRLAALGDLDTPAIQVTGFVSSDLVDAATRIISQAFALRGNQVSCSVDEPETELPNGGESVDAKFEEGIRVESVGPIGARFKWRNIAARSPTLVCVFEAGELEESSIQQFQRDAELHGVPNVSFLMVAK